MTNPPKSSLRVSSDLALPLDAVTETFSILGQRGSGKTSTAVVLAEEMLENRQRVAIVDPLGVWWGLRSSADGTAEGYPVVIFGGDHADLPLEPGAGELVANLLVDQHVACVIDLSHMRKGEQRTFMTTFSETLYHRNRDPLHLIVDEADLYAGQRPPKGAERLLGAMEDLVRRGRSRGIGLSLITQRPAVIHKDVLSQTSVLVAMRLVSPQDTKALDAWISQHDILGVRREVLDSLPTLSVGTAWVWSPGAYGIFAKVAVRKRRTYDSSATPKVGQQRVVPKQYATVDLDSLSQKMSALVERKAEEDPTRLRRRLAALTRELEVERARPRATAPVEVPPPTIVQVPVLDAEQEDRLREVAQTLTAAASQAESVAGDILSTIREVALSAPVTPPAPGRPRPARAKVPPRQSPKVPEAIASVATGEEQEQYDTLRAGAKRIMESLARFYPDALTRPQVGTLAKMRFKSGTFSTYIGELKRADFVDSSGDSLVATSTGMSVVGAIAPRPADRGELYAMWNDRLRAGAMRMLDVVLEHDPESVTRQQIAEAAELASSSGTFSTYLGELRRFDLVHVVGSEVTLGGVWSMVERR